jgi:hypothetical protein
MNISIPIPIPTPSSLNPSTPAPRGEAENIIRPASGGESGSGLLPPDLTVRERKMCTWIDAKGRWEDIRRGEELMGPLVGVVVGVWVKGKGKEKGKERGGGGEKEKEQTETGWA